MDRADYHEFAAHDAAVLSDMFRMDNPDMPDNEVAAVLRYTNWLIDWHEKAIDAPRKGGSYRERRDKTKRDCPMNDEQYGRAWCELNGKRPEVRSFTSLQYWYTEGDSRPRGSSSVITPTVFTWMGLRRYETETDAYAAVGRAVRAAVESLGRLPVSPETSNGG